MSEDEIFYYLEKVLFYVCWTFAFGAYIVPIVIGVLGE